MIKKKRLSFICYQINEKIPNHIKVKMHYELFLKNKGKKNPKA